MGTPYPILLSPLEGGQTAVPRPAKTLNFTLDLLRRHPQIHFEDAVKAAEAQELSLSRATFYKATKELGIRRKRGSAAEGPALADRPQSSVDVLVRLFLDKFRQEQEDTRRMRAALEQIREVLRDGLVRDGEERAVTSFPCPIPSVADTSSPS